MNNTDILNTIKTISHGASEKYLLLSEDMNKNILDAVSNKDVNAEIVRRICEGANQNVYMSLLNDSDTNRGDIKFNMADSGKIINDMKAGEDMMNEYTNTPTDFKGGLTMNNNKEDIEIDKVASDNNGGDLNEFATICEIRDTYSKAAASVETMKIASLNEASGHYEDMLKTAKSIAFNGESLGDLSKMASMATMSLGLDYSKTAEAYSEIASELKASGHNVNEGLTKVSSLRVDVESDVIKQAVSFSTSIAKVASFKEIGDTMNKKRDEFSALATRMSTLVNR